ncbi:MAG: BlaI/MecI/CopY family transcriptional regulator [bacterium]|nr:BlaI/MecI/CopY family transcriptional regulator [bacterium]
MARAHPQLSELQLAVLRVLWDRGELPVSEVHGALTKERDLAPTTVATLLNRLDKRGLVRRRREGRQYLYSAAVAEKDAKRSMVGEVTDRLFGGDVTELLAQLLDAREVRAGDLARIRELIDEKERRLDDAAGADGTGGRGAKE